MIGNTGLTVLADSTSLISIYKTCFTVCLSFAILFFIVSIVLFFVFDIRGIFNMKTGRAEKMKVKQMEETNASTGRLLSAKSKAGGSGQFSAKLNAFKEGVPAPQRQDMSAYQPVASQIPPQPLVSQPQQSYTPPPQAQAAYAPQQYSPNNYNSAPVVDNSNEYSQPVGADETSLLSRKVKVTTVDELSAPSTPTANAQPANMPQPVHHLASADELGKSAGAVQFTLGDGETGRLDDNAFSAASQPKAVNYKFVLKRNVMLIHTTEVID